jgi:hypothetical protein
MMKTIVILSSLASMISLAAPALAGDCTHARIAKTPVKIDNTAGVPIEAAAVKTRADSLFYVRLGQSLVATHSVPTGPELGLGYRLELDRVGIDASVNLAVTDVMNGDKRGFVGSLAKLTAQYYFSPQADRSAYLGGGLSGGFQSVHTTHNHFTGSGLQGEIVGGYEFMRRSTIRAFVQANASLPFYMSTPDLALASLATGKVTASRYLPTFGLSLGVAWGK